MKGRSLCKPYWKIVFIMKKNRILFILLILIFFTGCSIQTNNEVNSRSGSPVIIPSLVINTATPFLPVATATKEAIDQITVNLSEDLQGSLHDLTLTVPETIIFSNSSESDCYLADKQSGVLLGEYVLVLAAPFPTITDSISSEELFAFLNNGTPNEQFSTLLTTISTAEIMDASQGVSTETFQVADQDLLSDIAYNAERIWALIPFDELSPEWKVIRIDDISPYDQNFDIDSYSLTIPIRIECASENSNEFLQEQMLTKWSNRDPQMFTSVLLTGTTALTRAIAYKMELNGMNYPGEVIKPWFDQADISHISSEVSFSDTCPPANPNQQDLSFCGRPEYAQLFTYVGVDVIELSGNHLADKGAGLLTETLNQLQQLEIPYYAAGYNREDAKKPALFEHNGNHIAFIGCNSAGPGFVFATDTRSGVLSCDMEEMESMVADLKSQGYLPIVTFQYSESYQFAPMPWQRSDFRSMVDAGAVIVSGSQAHMPMTMEIYGNRFIHYGLGNLFFDQMDIPVVGTRREFLDRHIFYDGKYLGVDLLTAMLEDYAQPRPMTLAERESLLRDAFEYFTRP